MSVESLSERIEDIILSTAKRTEYDIYEFSIYLKGENSRISVKIDHLKGISHGDCGIFSKELAAAMDEAEILTNYSLEISSPGLSRELKSIDDFIRFTGSSVKIVYDDEESRVVYKGEISAVKGNFVEIKDEKGLIKLDYGNIDKANLDY